MRPEIFLSAFLGAGVEFLEIVAIAYALGRSGFVREALWGSVAGIALVTAAALLLGTRLTAIPLRWVQLTAGLVLLYFGWGWTKKSVLRWSSGKRAGWIQNPLRDPELELTADRAKFSFGNFVVMLKSAALETFEVAIIVITIALSSRAWVETLAGAGLALVATVAVIWILHGVLLRVPDVFLKLGAGLLLLAFGTFWLGEAAGLEWPGEDLSVLGLLLIYFVLSLGAVRWLRARRRVRSATGSELS
jgi:Ca2+/H+ antiporter, TMEM165/GDT1 family